MPSSVSGEAAIHTLRDILVQCTVYTVHEVKCVKCTLYIITSVGIRISLNVQCTLHSVQYALYIVLCTPYIVYNLDHVHCTMYNVHCIVSICELSRDEHR